MFLLPFVKVFSLHHLSSLYHWSRHCSICLMKSECLTTGNSLRQRGHCRGSSSLQGDLWPLTPQSTESLSDGDGDGTGGEMGGEIMERDARPREPDGAEWGWLKGPSCWTSLGRVGKLSNEMTEWFWPMPWGVSSLLSCWKKKRERMPWVKSSNQDEARLLLGCSTMP